MPLALLIAAVLVAGVVFAVMRQPEREDRAEPTPTAPETPTPETPTPETPTPETPTPETPTPETPTPETPTPPDDDRETPLNGETPPGKPPAEKPTPPTLPGEETPPVDRRPLAETGGPVLPFLALGSALVALSAALWRFSRPR